MFLMMNIILVVRCQFVIISSFCDCIVCLYVCMNVCLIIVLCRYFIPASTPSSSMCSPNNCKL